MATTLIVPDDNKVGKEHLLLGDVTLKAYDCQGNEVVIHGLTANDLVVKTIDGKSVPLVPFINSSSGVDVQVANTKITTVSGNVLTIQQIADEVDKNKIGRFS